MKIANGIEMLEISSNIMGNVDTIYPTLFVDKDMAVLVDSGYPGQLLQFQEALTKAAIPLNAFKKIIITHHDIDHIGSLSSITDATPNQVEILTHEIEKYYIEGKKIPVKLALLEAKLDALTPEMKSFYGKLKAFYDNCNITINKTVCHEEVLPYCGGIEVIFTPGHTPGHICLYHMQSKTLISGDCLGVHDGELIASSSFINYDQSLYIESLKKLAQYDIESIICYHGGLYKGNVTEEIKKIINKITNS